MLLQVRWGLQKVNLYNLFLQLFFFTTVKVQVTACIY